MKLVTKLAVALMGSAALISFAYAGSTTLSLPSGTGTARVGTDGSSNLFGNIGICDGAACANMAVVKAASTAAQATDPALVVAVSPNNTIAATQSGTWNIGSITTLPNVTLGAGVATIGSIANTSFASTQSGTWTVQPGNTANTTAWLVTGTGGTFPATQSGTWTVQPGNTANTTPWLASISQGGNTAPVKTASSATSSDQALVVAVANTNANGAAAASASSPVTPSNQPVGAATIATAQTSCGSTATSASAARTGVAGTGRVSITLTNTTTTAVYVGTSGVTTSNGMLLPGIVGASLTLNTTAQVYCIVASGSATITGIETY